MADPFCRRHEALFTYSLPDQNIVLVNARVAATSATDVLPDLPTSRQRDPTPCRISAELISGNGGTCRPIPWTPSFRAKRSRARP